MIALMISKHNSSTSTTDNKDNMEQHRSTRKSNNHNNGGGNCIQRQRGRESHRVVGGSEDENIERRVLLSSRTNPRLVGRNNLERTLRTCKHGRTNSSSSRRRKNDDSRQQRRQRMMSRSGGRTTTTREMTSGGSRENTNTNNTNNNEDTTSVPPAVMDHPNNTTARNRGGLGREPPRMEEQQFVTRKERIRRRLSRCTGRSKRVVGGRRGMIGHNDSLLSAEELGIENRKDYERLMEILRGGEISPEDFDLLLQLDTKNKKTTLEASEINQFDLLVVRNGMPTTIAKTTDMEKKNPQHASQDALVGNESCLICLEPFQDLTDGTELRCLPCHHIFCKTCVDHWLTQNSTKCPHLSCYW